jgi:N utilization substance protein B
MGRRTKARECAFQMLYQREMTGDPIDAVAKAYWRLRTTSPETTEAAERLAFGADQNKPAIDSLIGKSLKNWRFDRIAAVDRNILRVATYELLFAKSVPRAIVMDEAIEMAKRFGEADSPPFVNGVLDAVRRLIEEEA